MRRVFDIFAGLSLLACVAVCVVWVRSYGVSERVEWRCARGSRSVRSAVGYVEVGLLVADWSRHPKEFHGPRYVRDEARPPFNYTMMMCSSRGDVRASYQCGGFAWHEIRNRGRGVLNAVAWAPFWSLAMVTGLGPAAWVGARVRPRLGPRGRRAGYCWGCGYDLRATPVRCPECGLVAGAARAGAGIG